MDGRDKPGHDEAAALQIRQRVNSIKGNTEIDAPEYPWEISKLNRFKPGGISVRVMPKTAYAIRH
jgi:hypothetical protein